MLFFSLLWLPVFCLFWGVSGVEAAPHLRKIRFFEKAAALAAGAILGTVRFFIMNFWTARGFGLSRFIGAVIDYTFLPVAIPFVICLVITYIERRIIKREEIIDWTFWLLLSLAPSLIVCATRWGTEKNPLNLMLIPLLWTIIAVHAHPICLFWTQKKPPRFIAGAAAVFAASGLVSAAVYWAYFSSKFILATVLFIIIALSAAFITVRRLLKRG